MALQMGRSSDVPDRDWFRPVLDSLDSAILVERDERIVYANPAYAALLEYRSPDQLLGKHISSIIAEVDRTRLTSYSKARVENGRAPASFPFVARRSDGKPMELQAAVSTARSGSSTYIISLVSPIAVDEAEDESRLLSPREKMVFTLLTRGKRPKEIAFLLQISEKTVGTLRGRMMKKLGLRDAWDLFRFAAEKARQESRRVEIADGVVPADAVPPKVFDSLSEIAAKTLKAPVAFLSVVGPDHDYYPGGFGLPTPIAKTRQIHGETFCHHALIADGPLIVADARSHPLYAEIPTVESMGVAAYIGIPLRIRGAVVGALCVVDTEPRSWSEKEVGLLEHLARYAAAELVAQPQQTT